MIIDHRKFNNVDFKKYKRIFTFGCSFTHYYMWPTWANVVSYEAPDSEFYNLGQCGGGNLFITERMVAANQKFRFTKDDLIMTMWSTHSREDRYRDTGWVTPGNIFTQGEISADFVKEWACIKGYIVRDLALMTSIKYMFNGLPCDTILLKSVEPDYDRNWYNGDTLDDVIELYRDIIYDMGPTLHSFFNDGSGGWINGHYYWWPENNNKKKFSDYHPNTKMYKDYLKSMGFLISPSTEHYVESITEQMLKMEEREQIRHWATDIFKSTPNYHHNTHLI